jgi:GT2 family glycosyltransferase
MNLEPLVSVIVLNYKRLKELAECLDSVLRQEYGNLEIIVVDNHSEEDVAGLVHARSSAIRLIELPANLGACGGRNAGIREARGQILITIDNDVSFASPFDVGKVVQAFEDHPDFHVLAFRICDVATGKLRVREWCHPRDWKEFGGTEFETYFFGEGASAFRREVFDVAGLYWEPLFIGNEGYDLTLRIFNHGFRILYCPRVAVSHSMSPDTRPQNRPFYIYTRNYIWIAYKDFPLLEGIRYVIPKLLMMAFFAVRAGRLVPLLRGAWEGFSGLKRIERRTPSSRTTIAQLAELERSRPNWLRRFTRHRIETQL